MTRNGRTGVSMMARTADAAMEAHKDNLRRGSSKALAPTNAFELAAISIQARGLPHPTPPTASETQLPSI